MQTLLWTLSLEQLLFHWDGGCVDWSWWLSTGSVKCADLDSNDWVVFQSALWSKPMFLGFRCGLFAEFVCSLVFCGLFPSLPKHVAATAGAHDAGLEWPKLIVYSHYGILQINLTMMRFRGAFWGYLSFKLQLNWPKSPAFKEFWGNFDENDHFPQIFLPSICGECFSANFY